MKFIVVTGGVLSGLGKGIVSSSIGLLLKSRGYSVTAVKIDPYVSVDAGTMRPAEHGEVFVTHDGGEIDQDVGNYERFLDVTLSSDNNLTTGKIYQSVIEKERHFYYKGGDASVIPDVINEIKDRVYACAAGYDFCVVEIGGTTGDLENMPFLHAAREMAKDYPTVNVMVVYLPFLRNVGELKTKPAQHAIARLREIGIVPDFLVTRNEIPIDKPRIEGLARRSFVDPENIIDDPDMDNIYALPLMFEERQFAVKILSKFGKGSAAKGDLKKWKAYINNLEKPKKSVKIALVGKYVKHGSHDHKDVYVSVLEALKHGGAENKVKVEVEAISSEELQGIPKLKINERLKGFDGIVIPQGWGSRGYPGKINAIEYARVNKIPYLGLCFGMQMAVIEFARNVLKLKDANSQEIDKKTKHPVIHIMPEQVEYLAKGQYGGTIRLGAWPCVAKSGSKLEEIYGEVDGKAWGEVRPGATRGKILKQVQDDGVGVRDDGGVVVWERHRHRYEFNNEYREKFESKGMKISGLSPDGELVEAIEIKDHPFFVGTQYHPEYLSRPLSPHPLFVEFIKAAKK